MNISDYHVMKSAHGWYVGRCYYDSNCGGTEFPYSRDSGYYATEAEAQDILDQALVF